MKKLITLVVMLLVMIQLTNAQKRNIIKPAGLLLDVSSFDITSFLEDEDNEIAALNIGYAAGYERLLGSRLSVGLQFTKYFKINSSVNGYTSGYSGPQSIPGYTFNSGNYARTGFNVEYESRYYFREFDEDGVRSAYLGFAYQFASFTESFSNATYYSNGAAASIEKSYADQTFSASRLGIKFGYAGSNAVSSNFFAGIYFNIPGQQNKQWNSVKTMQPVSIYAGWTFGIPF
jgi:hypothetical protein